MNYYIYEDGSASMYDPLAATRPAFDIRTGAFTFLERLQRQLQGATSALFVRDLLRDFSAENHLDIQINPAKAEEAVWLLGNVFWSKSDLEQVIRGPQAVYRVDGQVVAAKLSSQDGQAWINNGGPLAGNPGNSNFVELSASSVPKYLWDIVGSVGETLAEDQNWFDMGVSSNAGENGFSLLNPEQIHIGNVELIKPGVCIDASEGPVIIDSNVVVGANSVITGPVYIGQESKISANADIRPGTVAGPYCNLGGEICRSIFQGYANKSHDGFLGDAFTGEWVNLGAGTVNSNLKNNYSSISVELNGKRIDSGKLHLGVLMGDHCKTAIGTKIITGSVFQPVCNIVCDGFPPKNLSAFSFLYNGNNHNYDYDKFLMTAKTVMKRRNREFSDAMNKIFKFLYDQNNQ